MELQAVPAGAESEGKQLVAVALRNVRMGNREQMTYKVSAIAASIGVTALAIAAVHYRFSWHVRDGADFPTLEAVATLLLTVGGVVSCPSCRRRCFDCFCVWVI